MKRFMVVAAVAFSVVLVASPVFAKPGKRFDPASTSIRELTFSNLQDGYRIFREVCKSCHYRGNAQGAKFLHTESKSMRAWNRVFAQRYPKCAQSGDWKALSKDDLLKLNDYLFANAVDTVDVSCYL